MVNKHSVEAAYCFFHQKKRVYDYSTLDQQKEDIVFAITSYVETMDPQLYELLAQGNPDFLLLHKDFANDLALAVSRLETLMQQL